MKFFFAENKFYLLKIIENEGVSYLIGYSDEMPTSKKRVDKFRDDVILADSL